MSDLVGQEGTTPVTVREAVGVFDDTDSFEAAVDELLNSGFDRSELSLLATDRAVEAKLGHLYDKVSEVEDDPSVPRTAYVGRNSTVEAKTGIIGGLGYVGALAAVGIIVATGGTVAAALLGAAAAGAAGSGIGTIAARLFGRERAVSIQHQLEKGGLLLWVRTRDAEHERRALEILSRHGADDVHVHELPAPSEPSPDPLVGGQPDPFLPGAKV